MSKWRKWLSLSACVIAAIVLAVVLTREREPSYQGRSLSSWLKDYTAELDNPPEEQPAKEAIRHIGTNALPYLLKWTSYESPHFGISRALKTLLPRIPDAITPEAMWRWAYAVRKKTRAEIAATAYALVGDQARLAIPDLVKLMNDPKRPEASGRAVAALAYIGKDALPEITAQLANPDAPNRAKVVTMCGLIPVLATNVDVILPLLIRCLDDHDPQVRVQTARSLGRIAERYGLQPATVVPALTNCLRTDSSIALRQSVVRALGNYGHHARDAVPQLLQMTDDPVHFVRITVTNALMKIAPESITHSEVQNSD